MGLCNSKHYSRSQCDDISKAFKEVGLDVFITPEETQNNPGLKQKAKGMLNNLWGKTSQRPVMTEYKHCKSYQEFVAISSNSNIEITFFAKYMMTVQKFILLETGRQPNALTMYRLLQRYSSQHMQELDYSDF